MKVFQYMAATVVDKGYDPAYIGHVLINLMAAIFRNGVADRAKTRDPEPSIRPKDGYSESPSKSIFHRQSPLSSLTSHSSCVDTFPQRQDPTNLKIPTPTPHSRLASVLDRGEVVFFSFLDPVSSLMGQNRRFGLNCHIEP